MSPCDYLLTEVKTMINWRSGETAQRCVRVIGLAALIVWTSIPDGAVAFYQGELPMMRKTVTNRLELADFSNWSPVNVTVIVPGDPSRAGDKARVQAFEVAYRFRAQASVVNASIVMVRDPTAPRVYAMRGGGQTFYIAAQRDMLACLVGPGEFVWGGSRRDVRSSSTDPGELVRQLVSAATDEQIAESERRQLNHVDLRNGAPFGFFLADSDPRSSAAAFPTVDGIEVTGEVVRLSLRSPGGKHSGVFWVDLGRSKLVKSTVDGVEMDVTLPYAGSVKPLGPGWRGAGGRPGKERVRTPVVASGR